MDVVPLSLSSPTGHLDGWHALGIAFWRDELPEVDPPGRLQALADLDSEPSMQRGAFIALEADATAGVVSYALPMVENTQDAEIDIVVAPEHRRRGTGRLLLDTATAHVASLGRTRLVGGVKAGAPGEAFAQAAGARVVQRAVCSVLDVRGCDAAELERLAAPDPAYRLVQWRDRCPDDLVDRFARARMAMNDAPHGDEPQEEWEWTADRVREREEHRARWQVGCHTSAAVHVGSGDIAGFTELLVVDRPTTAMQEDTGVLATHRGHRLGLSLKAANLLALSRCQPAITTVMTWNAESNRHMRAVNELLGFRVASTWLELTKHIGATAQGSPRSLL